MKYKIPRNGSRNVNVLEVGMAGKKGGRDADILVLLWEVFKTRACEIDQLLELSRSILASTNDFPQKTEVENALKKALILVRT